MKGSRALMENATATAKKRGRPFEPGNPGGPGRPRGSTLARNLAREVARRAPMDQGAHAIARHVFEDRASLQRILELMYRGKLPQFITRLRDEAYGRPTERIEVDRPLLAVNLGEPCRHCGGGPLPPDPLGEDPPGLEIFPPPRALPARRVEATPARQPEEPKGPRNGTGGPDLDQYRF